MLLLWKNSRIFLLVRVTWWAGWRNSLRIALDRSLTSFDVTGKQLAILSLLYNAGDSTPARLAEMLAIDMGAVTRLLDRLEKKRLIARKRNPNDRRSVTIQMTATGKTLQPELAKCATDVVNKMVEGVDSAELALASSVLQRMLLNLSGLVKT